MTPIDRLEGKLNAGLTDLAGTSTPDYRNDILRQVARTRQRPAWTFPERWLPMAVITRPAAAALPLRLVWLLLVALLILALAASIAFVGSQVLRATVAIPQGGAAVFAFDSNGDIFTVKADGTDLRQLTSGRDHGSAPSWSPDGTRIAYRLWQDGSDSVAVMGAGGGTRTILATTNQTNRDCVPYGLAAWSPDGTMLVFPTSAACDGRNDLSIVATDGLSPATRLLAPGMNSTSAAWSPDGTRIAFVGLEATGDAGLYVVDVGAGSALAGGLQARRITDAGTNVDWFDPRWSPDGTEVAAAAGTNDACIQYNSGTLDALIVKADGSGQRTLAAETAKEYVPTWSPDGHHLAFQRLVDRAEWVNGRPCTTATWVIDADGTNERRLEGFGPDPTPPLWSPDGTRLAVGLFDGLHFITVDGSSPLVVVPNAGGGSWQPVAVPLPPAPSFAAVSPAP